MEGLELRMMSEISEAAGSWKLENGCCRWKVSGEEREEGLGVEMRCLWILCIFLLKKCIIELHVSGEYRCMGRESGGLRSLLSTVNRVLGLSSLVWIRVE